MVALTFESFFADILCSFIVWNNILFSVLAFDNADNVDYIFVCKLGIEHVILIV